LPVEEVSASILQSHGSDNLLGDGDRGKKGVIGGEEWGANALEQLKLQFARPELSSHQGPEVDVQDTRTYVEGYAGVCDDLNAAKLLEDTQGSDPHHSQPSKPDVTWKVKDTAMAVSSKTHLSAPNFPRSPLMDPEVSTARSKHLARKCPPSKTPTKFQLELRKNPYALALATSVRVCQATKTTLPSYFLQSFGLMAHPESGEPWWVPKNLESYNATQKNDHQEGAVGAHNEGIDTVSEIAEASEEANLNSGDGEVQLSLENIEHTKGLSSTSAKFHEKMEEMNGQLSWKATRRKEAAPKRLSIGPSSYHLARQDLLHGFLVRKSGFEQAWRRMGQPRFQQNKIALRMSALAGWRVDMDTHITELMRRRVVESLEYLSSLNKGYFANGESWERVLQARRQAGAVLWTSNEPEEKKQSGEEPQVPEFPTLDYSYETKRKLPVYNLELLLGGDHLSALREMHPMFRNKLITLKDKRTTVDLQMKLWKLQGYLATYREYEPKYPFRIKKIFGEGKNDVEPAREVLDADEDDFEHIGGASASDEHNVQHTRRTSKSNGADGRPTHWGSVSDRDDVPYDKSMSKPNGGGGHVSWSPVSGEDNSQHASRFSKPNEADLEHVNEISEDKVQPAHRLSESNEDGVARVYWAPVLAGENVKWQVGGKSKQQAPLKNPSRKAELRWTRKGDGGSVHFAR